MASPCLVLAACLFVVAAAEAAAALEPLDDATVLLQHSAAHAQRGHAPLAMKPALGRGLGAAGGSPLQWLQNAYFCSTYGGYCQPPFDCHKTDTEKEGARRAAEGTAADGKPNYKTWCISPEYLPFITRCAAGNLVEAGQVQYHLTSSGAFGPYTMELDGSYCFIDGHCVNDAVTNSTTVEEASKMCDERFGHEAWTKYGASNSPPEDTIGYGAVEIVDPRNGFTSGTQTRPYLLAACAMGNYHCDVVYCKETYCKEPYYVQKYGHFLKDNGWVK